MLKVTFQFSFNVTFDQLNILTGTNQKLKMPLVTLGWGYFATHDHYLNKRREPLHTKYQDSTEILLFWEKNYLYFHHIAKPENIESKLFEILVYSKLMR